MKNIAINGYGRIGRTFLRTIICDPHASSQLNIAAINIGPGLREDIDLYTKFDTLMGTLPCDVSVADDGALIVGGKRIAIIAECDPEKIPWKKLGVEWVVDATGCFTSHAQSSRHLHGGARKVLITAPSKDADITIIPGVNSTAYNHAKHHIVSLGSCTTNCFAPIVKVIKEQFTLEQGLMTTVHAYTNSQVLLDVECRDPRRGRAAALNIVPTRTGASNVITQIYPELAGKLFAQALRVPVAKVSIIDFTFNTKESLSVEKINDAFRRAADTELKAILHYTELPLVSADYANHPASCIIDAPLTLASGTMGKVFGWYDNEWGYCERLKDFLLHNH